MTFIGGLIPLVRAIGPVAIGNRAMGHTPVGGMLMGTLVGVLLIPGLYHLFGKAADGHSLIKDEHDKQFSELVENDDREELCWGECGRGESSRRTRRGFGERLGQFGIIDKTRETLIGRSPYQRDLCRLVVDAGGV